MAIQLDDLVARLRLDDSSFNTKGVTSKLSSASTKMRSTGRELTTGLTLPIVGAAVASVKLAGDFDQTMRQVGIATNAPTSQLEKLALTMGAKTAFSAGDAADAMLELAKNGMTAATIQGGALDATMTLAAAGQVSLADASTFTSNALNAFGLSAKDAQGVAVALAGGANASSASVQSLGQGLSQVSATAHAAGLGLDETVGILSALDAQGIKGSDAGTSLKTMLSSLVPQTKRAKDEMKRLGLSFSDANGNMDDADTIAAKLHDTFGDMSEAQRISSLRTIFGNDAFRAANALVDTGEKGLRRYITATHDEETANKLAQSSMEGINGSLERAKGSLETAGITIGKSLAPVVEDLAHNVEDAANWFAALDEKSRKQIVTAALVVAALGPLLIITGRLVGAVSSLVSTGSKLINFMANLSNNSGTATTRLQKLGAAAKLAAGAAGIALLADSLHKTADESSILETAAGGALAGTVFGPWGAAAGGAAGLIGGMLRADKAWSDHLKDEATPAVADYTATLNTMNGAITKSTRSMVAQTLQQDDVFTAANKLKISTADVTNAVLGQHDAQEKVSLALSTLRVKYDLMRKADEQSLGTAQANANYSMRIEAVDKLSNSIAANSDKLRDNIADQKQLLEAVRGGTVNVHKYNAVMQQLPPKVQTAFEQIGVDSTKRDVIALGKQYKLTPKQVTTVMKALGFKDARDEADDTKQHIDDVDKVQPNLNPFKQNLLGALRATKSEAGAEAQGIGAAIGSGINSGLLGVVDVISTTAANAVSAALAAARKRADAHSPSRVFMALGSDMGVGLALGVEAETKRVQSSFASLVDNAPARMTQLGFGVDAQQRAGSSVRRSAASPAARGSRRLRIELDVGGGRSFTGWLIDELDGREELAGTRRRMR